MILFDYPVSFTMSKKSKQTVVLFNPMPVKHQVAIVNKKTTSLQVPLVNVPLSLLALARMIRDDFDVRIINAVVDINYEEMILDACKDALCFSLSSMTCYQIRDGMNVSAAVKERYPDMPIIWGGYHPSTQTEQTLQDPNIDIVVIGQGELTFKEVVERLAKGQSLDGVPGIAYKDDGRIITTSSRGFTDLNEFPAIPYEMIDVEAHIKSYKFGERCLDYYISQGCAAGCSFCSEPVFCGRKWTGLEPETVVAELEYLAKTYNIDTFMIRDSDFFINVTKLKELCNLLIDKDLGLRLTSVNGRMEQLYRMDDEVWALARKAGVREVFIGVESGYQEALDAMNKGAKVIQSKICMEQCIKHDIDARASFMVGIPDLDTGEEIRLTFESIHDAISVYGKQGKLDHMDVLLSFFTPYPNTSLYQTAVGCGLIRLDTLGDWGDFDQVDFKAPWMPQEYYDLVKKFRDGMPWNSGCDFDEWCEFYSGIMDELGRCSS
ncbi:MAG TPA: B12-binding domain-containing radical SAM protein [Methanosarcinaceae archaeon]|nr:B12-binding domain-containing radical SAM protein [Methanosarcinaceae archaeon]